MSSNTGDRDILFGMLAIEMEFVSRQEIVAVRHAHGDKRKSLGQILTERGVITEEERLLLDALVAHKIARQGNDLEQTSDHIADQSVVEITRSVQQVDDEHLRREIPTLTLTQESDPRAGSGSTARAPHRGFEQDGRPTRFRIIRPHAKGGIGEVFLAHDEELGREVALKEIQRRHANNPASQERFVREAEITAGLEHPGIVPIYSMGRYSDGRPYYAMLFIRGISLKEADDQFHNASYKSEQERALKLRELLGRLLTVCNAVEYAHSRGVLHRDLKPGNIMLGKYCETLVVDWGLAKVAGRSDEHETGDESTLAISSASSSSETLPGSAVGTPAYMSPEQAAGKLDELGPTTDIYSLGATLYHVLVGKPPFAKTDSMDDLLAAIEAGRFPKPRSIHRWIPRGLEAICLKAMATMPKDRYSTCSAMAEEIENWLADEPVTAWREPIPLRAARWARRHRTLVATSVSIATVAIVSLTVWQWLEKSRVSRVEEQSTGLVTEAHSLLNQDNPTDARIRLERAVALLHPESSLRRQYQDASDLLAKTEQQLARKNALSAARTKLTEFRRLRNAALFHGTLFTGTDIRENLDATKQATREAFALFGLADSGPMTLSMDPAIYSVKEVNEVREGCYELSLFLADAVAHRLPGQSEAEIQSANEFALQTLDRLGDERASSPAYHARRAAYLEAAGHAKAADRERGLAAQFQPATAADCFLLGRTFFDGGDFAKASSLFLDALRLRPDHFWAQYFLAVSYLEMEQPGLAIAHLTAAQGQQDFLWIHILKGYAHGKLGEFERADQEFQRAIAMDAKEAGIYVNRGAMRIEQGRLSDAAADLRQAIAMKPNMYQAHLNLAEVFRLQKKFDDALSELDIAITKEPTSPKCFRVRALVHTDQEDLKSALSDFEQAIAREPAKSRAVASDYLERGKILHRLGRETEAVADYDRALAIRPELREVHRLRGEALLAMGRSMDATGALDRFLNDQDLPADALRKRGFEFAKQGKIGEAIADYSRALRAEPDSATTRARRGWAFVNESSRLALADFDAAIRLEPTNGDLYNGRGYAKVLLGQNSDAVRDADKAIEFGPPEDTPRAKFSLFYNACCIYSQAAGGVRAAGGDKGIDVLGAKYEVRALELLEKALSQLSDASKAQTFRNIILPDHAIQPIRQSPGFLKLALRFASEKP